MPLFSVIIATHNRADLVGAALDSVFAQRCGDYEIIVVDDGSTDDTLQALESYKGRITLLQQKNKGPGEARNFGLSHARGDYITFLDSDDFLFPWALTTYQHAIERFNRPAFLLGSMQKFVREEDVSAVSDKPVSMKLWDDYLRSANAGYAIAIPGAIKRKQLLAVNGFAAANICSEGHDLYLRIGTAEGFVMITSPPVYAYRQHESTQSRDSEPLHKGARLLLSREFKGAYPGGRMRHVERSVMIARSLKYSIQRCIDQGDIRRAIDLYLRALPHFLRAGMKRDAYRQGRTVLRGLKAGFNKKRS